MDKQPVSKDLSSVPVFFIIGRPRSGTTLLRMLFEAHPNVIIPPESPFIINLYKKYNKVTYWDEQIIRDFCDDLFRQRYFQKWLTDKEVLLDKLLEEKGGNSFQNIYRKVCLAYTSFFEKKEIKLIGDKNPAYSLFIRRIHKLFPDSKIIHITRDYRDNYLSLVKVNFEVPLVPLVVYRWKFALKQAWKLGRQNPGLVYSIKYEDLVEDPEGNFKKLCEFAGMDYDPSVMDFYRKKDEMEKAYDSEKELMVVHQRLFNPISTQRTNLWKAEMSERQISIADLVAGKTAEKAGYERKYTSFRPGMYLWILPLLVYGKIMYRLILFGDHLPYRMRNVLTHVLGIFLKIYWRFNKRKVKPL